MEAFAGRSESVIWKASRKLGGGEGLLRRFETL
jgi:hypothetical protein